MSDDGTSFQIDIGVQSQSVDPAAAQLAQLADRLTAAGAASTQAAEAVRASEQAYAKAESSADRAAKALERIGLAAESQRGKLKAAMDAGNDAGAEKAAARLQVLAQRETELAAKAQAAKAALAGQAADLDKLKASAAAAATNEEKVSKAMADAKKGAEAAKKSGGEAGKEGETNYRKLASGLRKLGGPLGEIGSKGAEFKEAFGKISETLGAAGPYAIAAIGIAAVVAGLAALTAAAVAATVQIGIWAVGLADAARNNRLLADGIAKSVAGGALLDKKLTNLSDTLPLTREELSGMASQLSKAGLSGAALSDQLEKNATAAAKLKFGPDFKKEMLSLDQQSKRLHDGIAGIFGGLKIDKLLEQLSSLVDLFSENDAAGRAIKVVFESIFQPLIDGVTQWIPKVRAAFLQFEIMTLKALIAIKPFGSKILLVAEVLGALAVIIVGAIVVAIGVLVVNLTAMAAGFAIVIGVIGAVVAGVIWLAVKFYELQVAIGERIGAAIKFLISGFEGVVSWFKGFSLAQMGSDLIQGLINGITAKGAAVLDSIKGVVGGAVDGAKKLLGIASPSKVFAEIGTNTAAGMQVGLERGSDGVQSALGGLTTPPPSSGSPAQAAAPAPAPSPAKSGGASLQGVTFNFYGVEGAEDAQSRFAEALTRLLEGDVAQLGAAVPG